MARPDDACAPDVHANSSCLHALVDDAGAGSGAPPLAAPGFFLAWAAVGLAAGLHLAGRGHDLVVAFIGFVGTAAGARFIERRGG